jgi:uncharacterized membrane protein YdjX (TVP38/TMEM64 family)
MSAASRSLRIQIGATILLVLVVAAVTALGVWAAPHLSRARLESWVRAAGAWGPLVLFSLQVVQIVVPPIPGLLVPFVAGVLYGPWIGLIVAGGGTAVGSCAAYGVGRFAGRPLAVRWFGGKSLERAHALIGGRRWLALVPLFLVPFSPSDTLCVVAGLIGLDWRHFLVAVALGRLPKDSLFALAGAGLVRLNGFGA